MTQRRRVKQTSTLEERLARHAEQLRAGARAMPRVERERVLQKARQFDIAIDINGWLTVSSLQAPKSGSASAGGPSPGLHPLK